MRLRRHQESEGRSAARVESPWGVRVPRPIFALAQRRADRTPSLACRTATCVPMGRTVGGRRRATDLRTAWHRGTPASTYQPRAASDMVPSGRCTELLPDSRHSLSRSAHRFSHHAPVVLVMSVYEVGPCRRFGRTARVATVQRTLVRLTVLRDRVIYSASTNKFMS